MRLKSAAMSTIGGPAAAGQCDRACLNGSVDQYPCFLRSAGNVPTVKLSDGSTIPIGVTRPFTCEIVELPKAVRVWLII